jgi:opacity protein-like surface antigen
MRIAPFIAIFAGLTLSQAVSAQSADREGRWETRLGAVFQNSTDVDFEGGTTADIESGTGLRFGMAYHYTDNLEIGVNIGLDQADYKADLVLDSGNFAAVRGELEYSTLMVDGTWNLMSGPFTPFVTGGIGWSWVDTNVPTGLPESACWWDPWYGYICATYQDTKTIDGFAYQLGAGLRYDINDFIAVHGSYRVTWVDLDQATSTPQFDGFQLSLGWKF